MKFPAFVFFLSLVLLSGCCSAEESYFDRFYNSLPSGDDAKNYFSQTFLNVDYNLTAVSEKWEVTSFAAIAESIITVPCKNLPYGKIIILNQIYITSHLLRRTDALALK